MAFGNVSLDGLVEATQRGPPSEESECHLFGRRKGMEDIKKCVVEERAVSMFELWN